MAIAPTIVAKESIVMDKLRAMQAFVRIVDEGSLTAAANALGTSLPSVVRTLAELEASVGCRLLNRTTRRQALTEEGRHYLERSRRVLADIDDLEASLADQAIEPRGRINITAPVLLGQMLVAPATRRFVQRHDKVQCNLMLTDQIVNLLEDRRGRAHRPSARFDPGEPGDRHGAPRGGGEPGLSGAAWHAATSE